MDIEEFETPWSSTASLPSEDTIRENMIKHKKAILDCLNPSQLYHLFYEWELDRKSTSKQLTRRQKAELLFDEVIEKKAYSVILDTLERDTEHMGHRYIASLLKGQEFAGVEEIEESKKLPQKMNRDMKFVLEVLDVEPLQAHLQSKDLLTREEYEHLQNPHNSTEKKARTLVSLLKTKGPTAHLIFVHKCLAEESSHLSHKELYIQLTTQSDLRKRKSSNESVRSTKVTRRYPCYLEPPEGITTHSYIDKISQIRRSHMASGSMWKITEDYVQGILSYADNPLELKIAFLLESCNRFVLDRKPKEVLARVDQAREMCMKLYSYECNAQVLEGRCEWVLARLYQFTKDYEQAREHTNAAFSLIAHCTGGEENILINFLNGSLLVNLKTKSLQDIQRAIQSFKCAISLASEEDYGMNTALYAKLRLARTYIGMSVYDPPKSREEVSQDNVDEAKRVLKGIKEEGMEHRTKWTYFLTCSDVYRMDGQVERSIAFATKAAKLAKEHNLVHELEYLEKYTEQFREKYLMGTELSF